MHHEISDNWKRWFILCEQTYIDFQEIDYVSEARSYLRFNVKIHNNSESRFLEDRIDV